MLRQGTLAPGPDKGRDRSCCCNKLSAWRIRAKGILIKFGPEEDGLRAKL